ncbi:MAG: hypothetical protein Q7R47_04495 [Candidatus Diapherotrites archaeon]|nr:hypothetical protein [Candidatus Diapherotrites archaeon]
MAKTLGRLRRMSSGQSRDEGLGRILSTARKKAGLKAKPFLNRDVVTAMTQADRRFMPTKTDRFKVALSRIVRQTAMRGHSKAKEKTVSKLFGSGKFGLLVVKPELWAQRGKVKEFLRKAGIELVFSTPFVFSKYDLQRLYPHVMKDRKTYANFAVQAFTLQNAPCNVVVFRHQTPREYHALADRLGIPMKGNLDEKPQNAFNTVLKKYLREEISRPTFEKKGFRQSGVTQPAQALDALGFFERVLPNGFNLLQVANGLHFPDATEILADARTLLTFTDLKKIEQRFR